MLNNDDNEPALDSGSLITIEKATIQFTLNIFTKCTGGYRMFLFIYISLNLINNISTVFV